jgi:phosphate starvation-inducible PhoH-like protein
MSHKKTGRTKRNKKCVVPVDNEETFSDVLNYPFVPKEIPSNSDIKIRMPFELGAPHKEFLHLLQTNKTKAVFLDGPAGTGKTYLSVLAGLDMLNGGFIESIYYVRSIVESASRQMGALPGEVEDKFLPWTMPLIDKVSELTSKAVGEDLFATGVLKGMPINYCRGLTFNRALVIVDEAQNLTKEEITTILTRFGHKSKYAILGDASQADIRHSGFRTILDAFNTPESVAQSIHCLKFTKNEIVRSEILKYIVAVLEKIPRHDHN